jgi:hypothetical protein
MAQRDWGGKTPGERQVRADKSLLEHMKDWDPETRKHFFEGLKGQRDGLEPVALFDNIVGGFEYLEYVACTTCDEWMSRSYPGRGTWAVKHRNCGTFRYFADLDEIPEDFTTDIGPLEMLAGIAADWADE